MCQITAVRLTARGNPTQFVVKFGTGGGGLTVASVTTSALDGRAGEGEMKIAT